MSEQNALYVHIYMLFCDKSNNNHLQIDIDWIERRIVVILVTLFFVSILVHDSAATEIDMLIATIPKNGDSFYADYFEKGSICARHTSQKWWVFMTIYL